MTYVALGKVYGGDVENILEFCNLINPISGVQKPYHAAFLEKELLKRVQLWPVGLNWFEIRHLLKKSYKKALEKHFRLESAGPLPGEIWFLTYQRRLRYRSCGTIFTLDMAYEPALLSIQGYSAQTVQEYASKAGLSPVVQTSENRVLLPSEAANLQLSLGTVTELLS